MDVDVKAQGRELLRLGREYLRVSMDRSGRARSNQEQQDDNRRCWRELEFGTPYDDVSVSASRYSTKTRDGYAELVEDLRADRFGAEVLVLWESSRGSRRVGEWVELIDLCELRGVQIAVTEHRRIYDPTVPRDRRTLLEDAVDAEYESGKTSGRLKRAQAANAVAGRPHGRVPYGYRRVYDDRTGQLIGQEPEPKEATVVKEVFERIRAGHSLTSISNDLTARGIRTRSGTVFTLPRLRGMALSRLYNGERVHAPGAAAHQRAKGDGATFTPGVWDPLVPKRTWLAVQRILNDPARTTTTTDRPGKAKYLLSRIAVCDRCSGHMTVAYRKGRRYYKCQRKGCALIGADDLDELATDVMVAYLARPDHIEHLSTDDSRDDELAKARTEIAEIRAELDELYDEVGTGKVSAMLAARAEPQILERLQVAEAREAELATPNVLRGLIKPGEGVAQQWDGLPISAKRRIAKILLSPDRIGELRIGPRPAGRRGSVEERVIWSTGDD